jgi:hypothetical protein
MILTLPLTRLLERNLPLEGLQLPCPTLPVPSQNARLMHQDGAGATNGPADWFGYHPICRYILRFGS